MKEGLDAVIIAPTGIIGPNDFKLSRMGAVLIKLYMQKLFGLVDGGYNWVDVRDVVRGAPFAPEALVTLQSHCLICRKKAEEELGYSPRPLKQSIEETIRWYEKMGMLK